MKSALRQYESKGSSITEKFVVISSSTLPIKPFAVVYAELLESEESDFCFNKRSSAGTLQLKHRYSKDGAAFTSTLFLPKHDEWVVLNRDHATKLVERWPRAAVSENARFWTIPIRRQPGRAPLGK